MSCCHAGGNEHQRMNENHKDHEEDKKRSALTINKKTERYSEKMTLIKGGTFIMGDEDNGFSADNEGPKRQVEVNDFFIDTYAVTNEEFRTFVEDTGYKTDAEIFGWSFVFKYFVDKDTSQRSMSVPGLSWWLGVEGANWFQPEGPNSHITERMDHPVVHVSWRDANTFAMWSGKRLPTEEEWEYAARGGLKEKQYPWGDDLLPNGEHKCNIWQGDFPFHNTKSDGYLSTAPAKSFPPNGYGLYNVSGNVWEWTASKRDYVDGEEAQYVLKGGSYLCHHSYCNRYRVAARTFNTTDSSSGNTGFRCVRDVKNDS